MIGVSLLDRRRTVAFLWYICTLNHLAIFRHFSRQPREHNIVNVKQLNSNCSYTTKLLELGLLIFLKGTSVRKRLGFEGIFKGYNVRQSLGLEYRNRQIMDIILPRIISTLKAGIAFFKPGNTLH